MPAAVVAFGLVGFFVAGGALSLHFQKVSPPAPPTAATTAIQSVATATATATATPTATPDETASATPSATSNLFAGTWTGPATTKGDQITVVVEDGPLPVTAHYAVTMKNGVEYRRGNLQVVANQKHPNDQVDGNSGSEPFLRVGVDGDEMYGWVEVVRLTLAAQGELKSSDSEQVDFDHFHRSGGPQPYVSLAEGYGVPEYSDAESLGAWNTTVEGKSMRTYGYTSKASVADLHAFYARELAKAETLHLEKDDCKMRTLHEGEPVDLQIVDNESFRRVEISKAVPL